MLDALIPVVSLIGLIALSVYLFGLDSTNGAFQVAIFTAMSIAGLIAHKNGYSYPEIGNAVIGGISSAMGAIFILLAVGALIGTWNMAGTIPTIVDYGLRILNPSWFYLAVVVICAVTGSITGSSWTTSGTLGVAFVGIGKVMGLSPEITAGAVISGGYFGDKVSPLSETTILVPTLGRWAHDGQAHPHNDVDGRALDRDRLGDLPRYQSDRRRECLKRRRRCSESIAGTGIQHLSVLSSTAGPVGGAQPHQISGISLHLLDGHLLGLFGHLYPT